ncbi:MAG TPA: hypothetical protein VFH37_01005 [Candidatus Saccharimonadales bacterium]|nr:hypothetical protein [Candidatus Saccharimonadales bacterium]
MSSKEADKANETSEGERWLELLGEEHLIGSLIPYYDEDGRQLRAEEFPKLDREQVKPIFDHIESLAPDDPKRKELIDASRQVLRYYLNKPPESN